jgi:hypothetical protein
VRYLSRELADCIIYNILRIAVSFRAVLPDGKKMLKNTIQCWGKNNCFGSAIFNILRKIAAEL